MLKLPRRLPPSSNLISAAFRRLCVETFSDREERGISPQPPSGGCVLKHEFNRVPRDVYSSRLQAAVC